MEDNAIAIQVLSARLDDLSKAAIERVGKANMSNNAFLKKGKRSNTLCTINDLVREHKVHRLDLLLQGADGSEGDDTTYTNVPQGGYVGAVRDFMGCKLVVNAMASQEGDVGSVMGENANGRSWRAPRGYGVQSSNGLEPIELAETGATNHGNVNWFFSWSVMLTGTYCC